MMPFGVDPRMQQNVFPQRAGMPMQAPPNMMPPQQLPPNMGGGPGNQFMPDNNFGQPTVPPQQAPQVPPGVRMMPPNMSQPGMGAQGMPNGMQMRAPMNMPPQPPPNANVFGQRAMAY